MLLRVYRSRLRGRYMLAIVNFGALAAINPWVVLGVGFFVHLVIVIRNPNSSGGINWGLFVPAILLVAFIFGITFVTGKNPNGLHVPNAMYWRSPEHYPQAMAHIYAAQAWLASLMGIFIDLATITALRAKRSPTLNVNGPMAIALIVIFLIAMSIFVGIIGGGWGIPAG